MTQVAKIELVSKTIHVLVKKTKEAFFAVCERKGIL